MKHRLLYAIFLLAPFMSVSAAEDVGSVVNPGDTAATVENDANQDVKPEKPLRFLLGGGFTFGGDKLVSATYTDGSSDSISAGGGLHIFGGVDYRLNDTISLQSTLGYHFDSTKQASNGSAKFSRIPLELLAYYHFNDAFRFGGGLRIVSSPKLEGGGIASNINTSFANTVGLVVEGEYLMGATFGIKVRHVSESYRPSGGGTLNGDHFGVLANLYF